MVAENAPSGMPTLYWRPGCPYCSLLRRRLRKLDVDINEVDIWADPLAAATVRSFADGHETVPTVVVGDTCLVNPSASAVVDLIAGRPPNAAGGRSGGDWTTTRLAQWVTLGAVIAGSVIAEGLGHAGISWGLDGVALAVFAGFRAARRGSTTL